MGKGERRLRKRGDPRALTMTRTTKTATKVTTYDVFLMAGGAGGREVKSKLGTVK